MPKKNRQMSNKEKKDSFRRYMAKTYQTKKFYEGNKKLRQSKITIKEQTKRDLEIAKTSWREGYRSGFKYGYWTGINKKRKKFK